MSTPKRPTPRAIALAAEEARAACSKHTAAQRAAGIKRGMDLIAAGPAALAAENADLKQLLKKIGEKLINDCILHESHPIVKACNDPLGTILELKS